MSSTLQPTIEAAAPILTTFTDPAAGAQFAITLPDDVLYDIMCIRFEFITDANVATRHNRLILDLSGTEYARVYTNSTQLASLTGYYTYAQGLTTIASSYNTYNTSLPFIGLLRGPITITSITSAMQVGDQYTNIRVISRQFRDLTWSI